MRDCLGDRVPMMETVNSSDFLGIAHASPFHRAKLRRSRLEISMLAQGALCSFGRRITFGAAQNP